MGHLGRSNPPRDRPRPGPGEGVGGGVKTPSPPASRLAHSHPPSQHISSTRASACSAAVFGWADTGNQNRPHVRDAGARCATRARRGRCARDPWGPSVPGTSGAPDALRAPRAPSVPHAPAAPGAPRSGHAQSVPGAPAHVTAHIGKHVAPPHHPCRKPVRNRGGVPIMVSGGPAHSRPYASTPAVPVKNHLRVIAGWPHMIQI